MRWLIFASVAKREGYEQIAANLQAAAGGENHEWTSMYPGMAKTAREAVEATIFIKRTRLG